MVSVLKFGFTGMGFGVISYHLESGGTALQTRTTQSFPAGLRKEPVQADMLGEDEIGYR